MSAVEFSPRSLEQIKQNADSWAKHYSERIGAVALLIRAEISKTARGLVEHEDAGNIFNYEQITAGKQRSLWRIYPERPRHPGIDYSDLAVFIEKDGNIWVADHSVGMVDQFSFRLASNADVIRYQNDIFKAAKVAATSLLKETTLPAH